MTTVDFMFDKLSRMGDDPVVSSQRQIMNNSYTGYQLYNPYSQNSVDQALNLATNQPSMFVKGTNSLSPFGGNVNQSTTLERSVMTNPHIKITLQERPYKTIPYLGKGNVDVTVENQLKWGDTLREQKSVVQLGESSYLDLDNFPLHGYVTKSVNDRVTVDSQWSNGVNTRDMYKNKEYNKK